MMSEHATFAQEPAPAASTGDAPLDPEEPVGGIRSSRRGFIAKGSAAAGGAALSTFIGGGLAGCAIGGTAAAAGTEQGDYVAPLVVPLAAPEALAASPAPAGHHGHRGHH